MGNVVKFDLMRDKPKLDLPTLNFMWDELWRFHSLATTKNEKGRMRKQFLEERMKSIEYWANKEMSECE